MVEQMKCFVSPLWEARDKNSVFQQITKAFGGKKCLIFLLFFFCFLFRVLLDEVIGGIKSQFAGLGEVNQSLLGLSAEDISHTSAVVGTGEVRVEFDGAAEGLLRCDIV